MSDGYQYLRSHFWSFAAIWLLSFGVSLASVGVGKSYQYIGISGPIISVHLICSFWMLIFAITFHGLSIRRGRRTVAANSVALAAVVSVILSASILGNKFEFDDPFNWLILVSFSLFPLPIASIKDYQDRTQILKN